VGPARRVAQALKRRSWYNCAPLLAGWPTLYFPDITTAEGCPGRLERRRLSFRFSRLHIQHPGPV
jgi:hypothetical protein